MSRLGILLSLLVLTLSISLASSTEARKWRWNYDNSRGTPAVESAKTSRARRDGGAFGAVIDRLVRGCLEQAAELQSWPFEAIARIAVPDGAQRRALEALRGAIAAAAERISAECPRDVPVAPGTRLQAVEQAIEVANSAFASVEPALQEFYAALDDEQKARLLLSHTQARVSERAAERSKRRSRRSGDGDRRRAGGVNRWAGICEDLTAALRGWPIREIERDLRLSEPQRVAFYELVTSSLKAAETLASGCPAETALTPVKRVVTLRARLAAVRQATTAIQTALTHFYEALDEGQQARFADVR
jgi:hypothetical protein